MAKIAKNDPLPGKTRPNTTINGAAAKLNTGISQAHSILSAPIRKLTADSYADNAIAG